jgi:hypothetical protein
MQVCELIRKLQQLSKTGHEEVALVKTDGHDNPFTDNSFSLTLAKWDETGELLDAEDESGDDVILIG